jgi:drug/metabolite transporter (DMT)-like permease
VDKQKRAYLYAISAILLWSTIASAFKITLQFTDFYHVLLISSLVSLLCLFCVLIWQKKLNLLNGLTRVQIGKAAVRGFLNPFLYYLVLLKAYTLLKAQEAGTLNYIWPITLVLLSIPLLKQKIGWKSIIAIFISFFGIVVISTEGNLSSLEFREPLGVFLAVGSSILWALFWILNVKDKSDDVLKLLLNFLYGTIYIVAYMLLFKEFEFPTLKGIAGAVYIGLFEMGFTYILWLLALRNSENTARVSNLVFLSPFISLIIIQQFVGEKILLTTIIGLALIVGGILLQQLGNRKN